MDKREDQLGASGSLKTEQSASTKSSDTILSNPKMANVVDYVGVFTLSAIAAALIWRMGHRRDWKFVRTPNSRQTLVRRFFR
jgi:hypothetical protein